MLLCEETFSTRTSINQIFLGVNPNIYFEEFRIDNSFRPQLYRTIVSRRRIAVKYYNEGGLSMKLYSVPILFHLYLPMGHDLFPPG